MLQQARIDYTVCSNDKVMLAHGFDTLPQLQVNETIMDYVDAFKWIYNNYLR
jgi:hypothetical protein